jgi:ferritin-like metal-binding protein YciE
MTEAMSKISLKSALKQAELAAKNQVEKIEKVIESIESLPDSFSKEKLKKAISEGNFGAIFASPSNEDKEKKSVYDKDQYVAAAVDASKEMMSAERALQ